MGVHVLKKTVLLLWIRSKNDFKIFFTNIVNNETVKLYPESTSPEI